MRDLKTRTLRGLSWSAAGLVVRQPVTFVTRILMARMLGPDEVGRFAMLWVVIELGRAAIELGLGHALIQKRDADERHRATAFWTVSAAGVVVAGLCFVGAPLVSLCYGADLTALARAVSVVFLLHGVGVVHSSLLASELDFRRVAAIDVGATFAASAVGLGLAAAGFEAWSLVWHAAVHTGLASGLSLLLCRWRPAFTFERAALRDLLGFGRGYFGHRLVDLAVMHVDDFLVGRFVGAAPLAFYTRAYWLMLFPLRQVQEVVTRVMFPALSSIGGETKRFRGIYLSAVASIALVTFPLMLGLLVVADRVVLVLYGAAWAEVTPVLRIFCIVGLTHSIGTTTGWIFTATGRTDLMFRWGLVSGLVKCAGIAAGLPWGGPGVAAGYTIATLVFLTVPGYHIAGRLIDMRVVDVARAVGPVLASAAAMAGGVAAFRRWVPLEAPVAVELAVEVGLGVVLYATLVHVAGLRSYRALRGLLARRPEAPDGGAALGPADDVASHEEAHDERSSTCRTE